MNWPALFASVALVATIGAQSGPTSPAKGSTITLRACVQPGTHGSPGNLSDPEVISGGAQASSRAMYWFYKNLEEFRLYTGSQVEIVGTVAEVLQEPVELKATDGVFAEVTVPAENPSAASGARAVGTAGAGAPDSPTTVIKAEVTKVKTLGRCR